MKKIVRMNWKMMIAFMIVVTGIVLGSSEDVLCTATEYGTYEWGLAQGFDAAYYAEANPDVAAAVGTDPVALWNHYINSGCYEGRKMYEGEVIKDKSNEIIVTSQFYDISAATPEYTMTVAERAGFDWEYYRDANPDVKAYMEAIGSSDNQYEYWKHYITAGCAEHRSCFEGDPGNTIQIIDNRHIRINQQPGVKAEYSGSGYVSYEICIPVDFDKEGKEWASYMNQLVNSHRAANGAAPLELNEELCRLAQTRAQELIENMEHTRPNGTKYSTVFSDNNIEVGSSGENIQQTYKDGTGYEGVMRAFNNFKASSGHNKNMLSTSRKYAGYGFCLGSNKKLYVVQLFTRKVERR